MKNSSYYRDEMRKKEKTLTAVQFRFHGVEGTSYSNWCNWNNECREALQYENQYTPIKRTCFSVPNLRILKVTYKGPTNYLGSRICIQGETSIDGKTQVQRRYFSYQGQHGQTEEQAYKLIAANGFNVVCRACEEDTYFFMCNDWGEDWKEISDLVETYETPTQ